jgi:hypothetical protein
VEDLPRPLLRGGPKLTEGVEWPECVDQDEFCRTIVGPGAPNGALVSATAEWVGDGPAEFCLLGPVSNLTAVVDFLLGDIDFLP